jgi:hypothetical protein
MSSIDMTVWKPISNQHALLIGFHTAAVAVKENECRRALASTLHSLDSPMESTAIPSSYPFAVTQCRRSVRRA